jgi:hypothetical protein
MYTKFQELYITCIIGIIMYLHIGKNRQVNNDHKIGCHQAVYWKNYAVNLNP